MTDRNEADWPRTLGLALYVGADGGKAASAGTSVTAVIAQLEAHVHRIMPGADVSAVVAVTGAGGRDIDAVRSALEPSSGDEALDVDQNDTRPVLIDLSRRRIVVEREPSKLTFKEFELLELLVLHEGSTVGRDVIMERLAPGEWADRSPRSIDALVRRLRMKLHAYGEVIRTVRRAGYRFDAHGDVAVRYASPAPSR